MLALACRRERMKREDVPTAVVCIFVCGMTAVRN